jgi:RNA polymerase sigma factor (sigma-70 family)
MKTAATLHHLVRQLRRTAQAQQADHLPDAELLERFRLGGDADAFEAIVLRHGGLVLAACRKVLSCQADVEDVFQATFVVLLHSARTIRQGQALGGWLTGVAHRLALKALAATTRRRRAEQRKSTTDEDAPDLSWHEACAILHQELDRLPDTYRLPLLLCYLEGKSREEAARQLGCKPDVLRGRLERGRDRLRTRLTKRGIGLSVALFAVMRDGAQAGELPLRLVRATVEVLVAGRPSATVAALALGGGTLMSGKFHLLAALALLACMVVGVAGSYRAPADSSPAQEPAAAVRPKEAKAPAKEKPDEASITIAGRVVGPDGKAIAGAALYTPQSKKARPQREEDIITAKVGTTDRDGSFKVTFKNQTHLYRGYLVAHADGYGVDWIELQPGKPAPSDVTLTLVKDQPISGRILDTEGKPMAGVTVDIDSVYIPKDGKLDDYLAGWKRNWRDTCATPDKRLYFSLGVVVGAKVTDREGRYKLTGLGAERIVQLSVHGRGVAKARPWVLTRNGLDAKPYNEAANTQMPAEFRRKGDVPVLYGPEATIIVEAGKVVEGVVKDLRTGKPLGGFSVSIIFSFGEGAHGLTDADGKYRLEGLPQEKDYQVYATPPTGSAYLRRSAGATAAPGTGPTRVDIELAKGIVVSGRVIDRQTGEGVQSGVRFAPLAENKFFGKPGFDGYRHDRTMTGTDHDGRFRVVTIPGKSLMMVQTHGREKVDGEDVCPYLTARPEPDYKDLFKYDKDDDEWTFTSAGGLEFLNLENVVKVVDLKEDVAEFKIDLMVERGKTVQIEVQDTDGKPLSGVMAAGVTAHWPITYRLKKATATVYALDPERPRRLVFLHSKKKLGGTVTLRGDEKGPVVVKLSPLGSVTGRLLEIEGAPLAGAEVSVNGNDTITRELYRFLEPTPQSVKTDAEGRFTLPGVVPGVKFYLQTRKGDAYFVGEPKIGLWEVEAGKTLDLGEHKVKPQR